MDHISPRPVDQMMNVHSPAGQVFASIEGPSTAYRLSDGKPSAEKTSAGAAALQNMQPAPQQPQNVQYMHNMQNRMHLIDRSLDKILNVIAGKQNVYQ